MLVELLMQRLYETWVLQKSQQMLLFQDSFISKAGLVDSGRNYLLLLGEMGG